MLLELVLLAALVFVVVAAVTAWLGDGSSARHRRIEHRAHAAEREIDEIGRRTQEAILAEAYQRARSRRLGR